MHTSTFDFINTSSDKFISLFIDSSHCSREREREREWVSAMKNKRERERERERENHNICTQGSKVAKKCWLFTFNDFERGIDWFFSLHDLQPALSILLWHCLDQILPTRERQKREQHLNTETEHINFFFMHKVTSFPPNTHFPLGIARSTSKQNLLSTSTPLHRTQSFTSTNSWDGI